MVTDFCAGTCLPTKTCLLLDHHRNYVGCDLDLNVLMAAEPDLLSTFALQVLNTKSNITGAEEVRVAARAFKENVTVVSAWRKATT